MQNLLDKYIIPTYMKRMGLKPEQQMEYAKFEPTLDPKGAYHKKLEYIIQLWLLTMMVA